MSSTILLLPRGQPSGIPWSVELRIDPARACQVELKGDERSRQLLTDVQIPLVRLDVKRPHQHWPSRHWLCMCAKPTLMRRAINPGRLKRYNFVQETKVSGRVLAFTPTDLVLSDRFLPWSSNERPCAPHLREHRVLPGRLMTGSNVTAPG